MGAKMKRRIRWGSILLLTALLLPAAVLFMLYLPPIQDAARRWSTAWLTEQTGIEIRIGSVHLLFPLRLEVSNLEVGELLSIERFATNIRFGPLMQGTIYADFVSARGISFRGDTTARANIHAQRLRADDIVYRWSERQLRIQDILVTEGDIAVQGGGHSMVKDSVPFRLPLGVAVSRVRLRRMAADYADEQMQMGATAGNITLRSIVADTATVVSLGSVTLQDGAFTLVQRDKLPWEVDALTAQAESLHYTPTGIAGRLTKLSFEEGHGIALREGTMSFAWQEGMLTLPHFAFQTEHSSLNGHLRTLSYSNGSIHIDGDADMAIGYADALFLADRTDKLPRDFARLYPTETLSVTIALDGPIEQLRLTQCSVSLPTAFDIKMHGTVQGITAAKQREARCQIEVHTYDLDFLTALADSTARKRFAIPHGITCRGALHYAPDTLHALCALNVNKGTATLEAGFRPTRKAYTLQVQTDSLDLRHFMPEGELGQVSMQVSLEGKNFDYREESTTIHGALQLHALQWREYTFSNASAHASLIGKQLHANATYSDSLMQWNLTAAMKHISGTLEAQLHAQLNDLNMKVLQIADTDIHPGFRCYVTLRIDSATTYTLNSRFSDIMLSTATQTIRPKALVLNARITPDTALLGIRSGDLALTASAHAEGLPWQWKQPVGLSGSTLPNGLTALQATLAAGDDNPASNYLALLGVKFRTLHATINDRADSLTGRLSLSDIIAKGIATDSATVVAHYAGGTLHAHLHTEALSWSNPLMQFQGSASGTLAWGGNFTPDSLSGLLRLSTVEYNLPAYNLQLHTVDTLSIPLERGVLTLTALPLYTTGKQPLLLDGHVALQGTPSLQLRLTARETNLLRTGATRETQLYGKALVSGSVTLSGPFNALAISGNLQLRPGSSIHYIYKDAILTANNQLDNVVTFVDFAADTTAASLPRRRLSGNGFSMNLNLSIAPTVQLEVSLGRGQQNTVTLQGGGILNLQYIPAGGLRLSGRYTIEGGELNMNVPLLHANHMAIRPGSTVTWSGSPQNPQLDITAEERIRASVTLDGSPQSVLFVTGLSLSDTLEKLGIQFTLSSPENASMQNTLAALSPEERSKLAVALLTTGLYLGEGGTGNLMNTALMGILQSQLDNISRDAFRTVDVSVGIEPLPDGVSGISTRTDYSFSLAKRFWNDRIRIIIGGSVTTSNERIEDDAVIDNIIIEWRINPVGNQYLRFFYDKNYESILEGEIRETGVGYAYRRQF